MFYPSQRTQVHRMVVGDDAMHSTLAVRTASITIIQKQVLCCTHRQKIEREKQSCCPTNGFHKYIRKEQSHTPLCCSSSLSLYVEHDDEYPAKQCSAFYCTCVGLVCTWLRVAPLFESADSITARASSRNSTNRVEPNTASTAVRLQL